MTKKFLSEKDVENHFRDLLQQATGEQFLTLRKTATDKGGHWETDGFIEWSAPCSTSVKLLLEAKFGKDLQSSSERSSVLAQVLYYCKRFEDRGSNTPNVIFVGDDTHCFALDFRSVQEFLNSPIDWSRPPSSPDKSLEQAILDKDIPVYLEETLAVDGKSLKAHCEELAKGCVYKTKPNTQNLSVMFQYWVDKIFYPDKYTPVEMTHIFFGCVLHGEHKILSENKISLPEKDGVHKEFEIRVKAMEGFFTRREMGLKPSEIKELVAMRDRIIEDDTRRRQGAFYTPTLWTDEAHKEMTKVLGTSWRDECIVWDCCAGTGNLTRDYKFNDLILSTAEAPDVKALLRIPKNKGAHIFQYDFLNPDSTSMYFKEGDGDNVLPLAVKKLLTEGSAAGKRLVFFINPPYAEDGIAGAKGESRKGVASSTLVNKTMPKLGRANRQLYAQFLYQCEQVASEYGFKQKSVGVFCKPAFMTTGSFAKFRPYWYERYSYQSGFLFQASHFADVSGAWGVSLTLWNEGKTDIKQDLPVTLKDLEDECVIFLREKHLYASEGRDASTWVSALAPKSSPIDTPKFSSGLNIREVEGNDKGVNLNGLGVMCNKGNNLVDSATGVALLSGKPTDKGRCNFDLIEGEGWRRAIALYSARKLVKGDWVNDKDEYLAPQTELEGYDQWVDDCHVYALLHTSNNMTAMRDITYKGKKHNIHNHFFWLTRKEALDLYDQNLTQEIYGDAEANPIPYEVEQQMGVEITPEWRKEGDPYFAHILPTLDLSPLAREIMDDLNQLFIKSFLLRTKTKSVTEKGVTIDLHLHAWDSGIYQHKKLWATDATLKADWEALKVKHKKLAKSLEPGVYTYGFLK